MANDKSQGTSMLDSMASGFMATKVDKSRSLTPLRGEAVAVFEAGLPNDTGIFMSNEQLADHAKALRKFAADALLIAAGIDAMTGPVFGKSDGPEAPPKANAALVRLAGDDVVHNAKAAILAAMMDGAPTDTDDPENFPAHFAAQQAAAQAATFKAPTPEEDAVANQQTIVDTNSSVDVGKGWKCPTHGGFETKLSVRRNVNYRRCPKEECHEFEKL